MTTKRAMVVISRDDFIDWAWSSEPLLNSGIFYKARQITTPLPSSSVAAELLRAGDFDANSQELMKEVRGGIWLGDESIEESAICWTKDGVTLSLLIYPDAPVAFHRDQDSFDTFDQFTRNSRGY